MSSGGNRFDLLDEEAGVSQPQQVAPKKDGKDAKPAAAPKPAVHKKDEQHKKAVVERRGAKEAGKDLPKGDKPKRQFDRKAGPGHGKESKREGGGKFNWGGPKSDAAKAKGVDAEAAAKATEPESVKEEAPVEETKPAEPEGPVVFGLGEFLAQKAALKVAGDAKVARKITTETKGVALNTGVAAKVAPRTMSIASVATSSKKALNIDQFLAQQAAAPAKAAAKPEEKTFAPKKKVQLNNKNDFPSL